MLGIDLLWTLPAANSSSKLYYKNWSYQTRSSLITTFVCVDFLSFSFLVHPFNALLLYHLPMMKVNMLSCILLLSNTIESCYFL